MLRRTIPIAAASIPRAVWDPKHHNYKHVDSYAKAIADRRLWPAKRWAVGLEPRVLDDWAQFSLRNLAYAYNGKLRSCSSFPEMVELYQEMKLRGVRMDNDTAHIMLSRGARYPQLTSEDLFSLYDEMLLYGVRPDLPVAEVLHTVWEHTTSADSAWREARRLQLIALYDTLCSDEISRLAPGGFHDLLAEEVARYNKNASNLGGSLSLTTWCKYIATIDSAERLQTALSVALYGFVRDPHARESFPATTSKYHPAPIPHLHKKGGLRRPASESLLDAAAHKAAFADDYAVNTLLLSAVERLVDAPLDSNLRQSDEAALLLIVERFLRETGVFVTADLLAQMMDVCKYCSDGRLELAAQRMLLSAFHGSHKSEEADRSLRTVFKQVACPMDGRVIGRYIAARMPWSPLQFHITAGRIAPFRAAQVATAASGNASPDTAEEQRRIDAAERAEGESETPAPAPAASTVQEEATAIIMTASGVHERCESVAKLIQESGVLNPKHPNYKRAHVMEVFTGQAVFLRTMFLDERYPPTEEELRSRGMVNTDPAAHGKRQTAAAGGMNVETCEAIFTQVEQLKRALDVTINNSQEESFIMEPELEFWESLLLILKYMMDYLISAHSQDASSGADELFTRVAALRNSLVEDSRTKFGGRFKLLWLQEM